MLLTRNTRKNWITKAIVISCNKKEFLYKEWTKQPLNNERKNKYIENSKVLKKVTQTAKEKYEQKRFEYNSKNPRKLWNIINDKIGKSENKSADIDYLVDNNE